MNRFFVSVAFIHFLNFIYVRVFMKSWIQMLFEMDWAEICVRFNMFKWQKPLFNCS